ncbi:MAG: RagB/SusD family nutrient uptake outer membrane protein [Bacteroidota bacterium]
MSVKFTKTFSALLLSGALVFCACESKLDLKPANDITTDNALVTASQAEAALIGCYDAFQQDGAYGQQILWGPELMSDNCSSTNTDVYEFVHCTYISTTGRVVGGTWGSMFQAITRCNTLLAKIDGISMTDARKRQIKGEALGLRAFAYLHLVRFYGSAPIKTTTADAYSQTQIAKNTKEELYTQILKDLLEAQTLVFDRPYGTDVDRGRITQGVVNSLLADVYRTQLNWTDAAAASKKVLDNSLYVFEANLSNIFPTKLKKESIFEIQFAGNADGYNVLPDLILPNPPATYNFKKFLIPVRSFLNAFNANDLRLKTYMKFVANSNEDTPATDVKDELNTNTFPYKWTSPNGFNSLDNNPVYRVSELMLTRAEALNEMGYPNPEALTLVNRIRQRAALPAFTQDSVPTQKAFREQIALQRRLELCFEGKRWFDLVHQLEVNKVNPGAYDKTALDVIQSKTGQASEYRLILPIPRDELLNNKAMKQNPLY